MRPRWSNHEMCGHTVWMTSNRFRAAVRDLDDLTVRQRRFLGRIAFRIPQLIKAIVAGESESRCALGTRLLDDGRQLELELVVRAQKKEPDSPLSKWGSGVAHYPSETDEPRATVKQTHSSKP